MIETLNNDIYAFEIEDRPGARLCIGPGPTGHPSLWMELHEVGAPGPRVVLLAAFNGERQACATVNFLEQQTGIINRVTTQLAEHYRKLKGEP